MGDTKMNKMEEYLQLLNRDYSNAVSFLLDKYGVATDDYFKEKSYNKFFNGEIKSIGRGKISRTSEGLYCHHIDENKYQKMTDSNFIKIQNIPFSAQKKERLVYCDLIEHTILHTIISRETESRYGKQGLITFLIPNILDWYIHEMKPSKEWELNCYKKSFLESEDAFEMLDLVGGFL